MIKSFQALLVAIALSNVAVASAAENDPLPSWNEGSNKASIVMFVKQVTSAGSTVFVPPEQRIATFDNDGTLWSELPMYFQLIFALERVKAMAPEHLEWAEQSPALKAAMAGDVKGVLAMGEKGLLKILAASHTGMTEGEFSKIVTDWIATARHPRFDRRYTELIYQPMLELLEYLRANDFRTYITSGGGISFMRPWSEKIYGIPPEQVIGSSIKHKFEMRDGEPVLVRLPEINFIDDKAGKPVAINMHIGRRPIMSVGNSDGDHQMLQWATGGSDPRFAMIIHHTDAEREWA